MRKEFNNHDDIINILTDTLKDLDKNLYNFQVDIYLYVDEEANEGSLRTYWNVGGNSWLDDDHYTICIYNRPNNEIMTCFESSDDLCAVAGVEMEDLFEDGDNHDMCEVYNRICELGLDGKLWEDWADRVEGWTPDYEEEAESILQRFYEQEDLGAYEYN